MVSTEQFRDAMSCFHTGVTLITTTDNNEPHGMTANSFTSVSLNPPTVLISVDISNDTCILINKTQQFGVNILSHSHVDIAKTYSKKDANKRLETKNEFSFSASGLPVVKKSIAFFGCRVIGQHKYADHVIFIGKVEEMLTSEGKSALGYYKSKYVFN
tara:strand:- start:78 stop:551 length:474 start_codon:yes stop_codon:yes gene_type:complete